jgi:hypothetical protein
VIYTQCPEYSTHCRFCSKESIIIPFARLIEDPQSKRLIAGPVEHRRESLGTLCNQLSMFTKDVTQCPARLGLVMWTGIKADGCGIYSKLHTDAEMRDFMREKVIGQNTLEGVV